MDLDELRVKHCETRDAALDLAARVAERVLHGPFDPAEVLFTSALAASLTDLLTNERRLRRAIKAEVAG